MSSTTDQAANDQMVSASRVIAAPIEKIFDIVADPRRHQDFDGSDTVSQAQLGPKRLKLGAKFGMRMSIGPVPYFMRSKVVEFEENKRIAWAHFGKHRWRYEFEEVEGGTKVTETFDYSTSLSPAFIEKSGYPEKHKVNIAKTLERLDEVATTTA